MNKFHFWWNNNLLQFDRKHSLSVKSFIATQKDSEFVLWGSSDFSSNDFIKPLLDLGVQFKIYDPTKEAESTPMENHELLYYSFSGEPCVGSDLSRNIILYKYGGCYVDLDVVALKDFTHLFNYEFVYAWPFQPDRSDSNNAIMNFYKGSDFSRDLLYQCITEGSPRGITHWGRDTIKKVIDNQHPDFIVHPCMWFDPLWYDDRLLSKFFTEDIHIEQYTESYTIHWHNQWKANIYDGSSFALLEKDINRRLKL